MHLYSQQRRWHEVERMKIFLFVIYFQENWLLLFLSLSLSLARSLSFHYSWWSHDKNNKEDEEEKKSSENIGAYVYGNA